MKRFPTAEEALEYFGERKTGGVIELQSERDNPFVYITPEEHDLIEEARVYGYCLVNDMPGGQILRGEHSPGVGLGASKIDPG